MNVVMHQEISDDLDSSILQLLNELQQCAQYEIRDRTVYQSIERCFRPEGSRGEFYPITRADLEIVDPGKEFLLRKKLIDIDKSPAHRLLCEIIQHRLKISYTQKNNSSVFAVLTQAMRKKVGRKTKATSFPLPQYKEPMDLNPLIDRDRNNR